MNPAGLQVEVVYARSDAQHTVTVELPSGATVADALQAVAGRPPFSGLDLQAMPVGVFGDRVDLDRVLEHGDRIELYRPLVTDPREARRRRAQRQ